MPNPAPHGRIELYDTTLRDGTQAEGISLSVLDKLRIAIRLDEMGFDYIEGGYPLSNPKDAQFFDEARTGKLKLKHAKLVAFGMTRRRGVQAKDDVGMQALLCAQTEVVCVVGKSWDLHVTEVLNVDEAENLAMIQDSVAVLKSAGRRMFYDAEHFFDGFRANRECALSTIRTAREAGAECIILCDTNGGSLPEWVEEVTAAVVKELGGTGETAVLPSFRIGIHVHNDGGLAVANTLAAIKAGAKQVQGTINGIGERCGNVDLICVAANLALKMGCDVLQPGSIVRLTELSRFMDEQTNLVPRNNQPFVGISAFAHKGGMHVHAINKVTTSYEHISPALVGNTRRVLVSELGGQSNIAATVGQKYGLTDKAVLRKIQERVNEKESEGYQYEAAEASFDLLVRDCLGQRTPFWELLYYQSEVTRDDGKSPLAEAIVKLKVTKNEQVEHQVAEGNGPVDALTQAVKRCLRGTYPAVDRVTLVDYKVRVVDGRDATRARVRVEIEWRDEDSAEVFITIGVSQNIIDATYFALADGIEYKLSGNGQ